MKIENRIKTYVIWNNLYSHEKDQERYLRIYQYLEIIQSSKGNLDSMWQNLELTILNREFCFLMVLAFKAKLLTNDLIYKITFAHSNIVRRHLIDYEVREYFTILINRDIKESAIKRMILGKMEIITKKIIEFGYVDFQGVFPKQKSFFKISKETMDNYQIETELLLRKIQESNYKYDVSESENGDLNFVFNRPFRKLHFLYLFTIPNKTEIDIPIAYLGEVALKEFE